MSSLATDYRNIPAGSGGIGKVPRTNNGGASGEKATPDTDFQLREVYASKLLDEATREADAQLTLAGVSRYFPSQTQREVLPPLVDRFLETLWWKYLVRSYLCKDPCGNSDCRLWEQAVNTLTDLTSSVLPKTGAVARRRILDQLPELYERLHAGLRTLGVGPAEQDLFFADLARLHQSILLESLAEQDALGGMD